MLYIDLETRSYDNLPKVGMYRYVESPLFYMLMAAWAIDDDEPQVAIGEEEIEAIPGLWDTGVAKVAHNAPFETICLDRIGPALQQPWIDTMALAAEADLPQSLAFLAKRLKVTEKNSAGMRLINIFCKPPFVRPEDQPEKWEEFVEYCRQDVSSLQAVHALLPDMSDGEKVIYAVDQDINRRGIKVDLTLASAAEAAGKANELRDAAELERITGIDNANSTVALRAWFGGALPNLQSETVNAALNDPSFTSEQKKVLRLRKRLALVASKKYTTALMSVSEDGRLRGQFRFYGAHTGRWAGRGVQLHNLPRSALENPADELLEITALKDGYDPETGALREGYDPPDSATLKKLVRSMFVGPLVVSDYSAIEARVLAWLADETWVLDAFVAGRDIYVETAERMGGLTRFEGKVAVLALGYNGGVGSLRAMGYGDPILPCCGEAAKGPEGKPFAGGVVQAARDMAASVGHIHDEDIRPLVLQWRNANPHIVGLWKRVERAFAGGGKVGRLRFEKSGEDVLVWLPSGRALTYHNVQSQRTIDRYGNQRSRLSFHAAKGHREDTYGGRLVENITQAVARDVLAEALVRIEREGYAVVGHVHDEALVEVSTKDDTTPVRRLMEEQPKWADGLPLAATAFYTRRYRKG